MLTSVLAKVRDAPPFVKVVGVTVSLLSPAWWALKWFLTAVSHVQTGGQVLAALFKADPVARFVNWITAAVPAWVPVAVFAASALFVVLYMLVPTAWWKKPAVSLPAPQEPRQRPMREATDPLRTEILEISSKYAEAYRNLETASCDLSAAKRAGDKLTRERDNAQAENDELKQRLASAQFVLEAHGRLKPMLTMRDRLLEMMGRLVLFQVEMNRRSDGQKHSTPSSIIDEWLGAVDVTSTEFNHKFRGKLVTLAADLKQHYGFVHSGLTDEVLTKDVYGQSQIEEYQTAIKDAVASLDAHIIELVTKRTSLGER